MTKTETLADVLRTLSELLPKRFAVRPTAGGFWIALGKGNLRIQETGSEYVHALILAACMEECEARGFGWCVEHWANSPGHYLAEVTRFHRDDGEHECVADSACLALATALRDAIKAEEL